MKQLYFLILLAIAGPAIALAQTKDKDAKASDDVAQAVMKIEQELLDALLKADTSAGERYLADSFVFIAPDGEVSGKADFIKELKNGDLKIESSKYVDMKVQVSDADMAVVTYKSTDKGSYKGKDISGEYRWIDVFQKREGKWQLMVGQGTGIEKDQPRTQLPLVKVKVNGQAACFICAATSGYTAEEVSGCADWPGIELGTLDPPQTVLLVDHGA